MYFINCFRWFISAPEEKGPPIPIPPLKNDKYRRSTVLPYLDAYHYETERDLEEVYFTEHDLNRKFKTLKTNKTFSIYDTFQRN